MTIPRGSTRRITISIGMLIGLFLLVCSAYGKHKDKDVDPPFQYIAGTEDIAKNCAGRLEVLKDRFTFSCPNTTLTLMFADVSLMQYRPDVSQQVMNMPVPWKIKPLLTRVRENKYFTIVSNNQGKLRVVVLHVEENDMRPYFAEIELRSGKSVQEYRSYDEFN
jgi:hypothetical protein